MALTERYVTATGAGLHDGTDEANAFSWAEMVTDAATSAVGTRYNVKAGTYSLSATSTISASGSSTSPKILRGYSSTITDGYQGRSGPSLGLVTTNMPVIAYGSGFRLNLSGSWWIIESLVFTGTVNGALCQVGGECAVVRCKSTNSSTGASATAFSIDNARSVALDCDAILDGASGGATAIDMRAGTTKAIACRVKVTSTAPGILFSGGGNVVLNCNCFECGGVGISCGATTADHLVWGNTLPNNSGDGIDIISGLSRLGVVGMNIATGNGGYGIDLNNANVGVLNCYNRTRDNTSGGINSGTDWTSATSYGNVTTDTGGDSTDYTDATTDDFTLIAASPATNAGIPGLGSIGAYQRTQTGGGGGTETSAAYIG